jgi:PAS domain S-box-containing protein/putative nucleotidyltransferase with HDIG domain
MGMDDKNKTKEQLLAEIQQLRSQLKQHTCNAELTGYELEDQYRTIIDAMADAIHVVDRGLKIILFNQAFKKWNQKLGLPSDVVGMTPFDVFPFLPDTVRDEYQQVFDSGEVLVTEEATEIGGKQFITETRKIPMYENNTIVRVVTVIRDITERGHAEQALRESEERYRTLVETSPDAIVATDLQGTITAVSNRALALYGCNEAEVLLGKNAFDFISPKDRPRAMQNLQKVLKQGFMKAIEYSFLKKDGTNYCAELNAALIRDVHGQPKAFIATMRDVTSRKRAHEALRRSEEKYKTLTEHINVGIYRNTAGPKGKFIEANPAIVTIFGYKDRDEFLDIDVADLYQNPKDRTRFNEKMVRDGFVRNEELWLKKKDGMPMICSVSAVAIKDEHGDVQYYDGIIEDITERKHTEQDRQENFIKLDRILEETVDALASTLGKRDPYTGGHQKRVTSLACSIAEEMGLPSEQIKGLRLAGLLHDIGKIAIPAEILSKPSRLTEAEFNIVKDHPQIGHDIIKSVEFPWPIADIVLQHHELLDGSGYPVGLKDGKIRLEAKIMVVADVVEAMSSHRPYRPAHSLEMTLEEISKYRGILYDEDIVDICLKLFLEKAFRFNSNP